MGGKWFSRKGLNLSDGSDFMQSHAGDPRPLEAGWMGRLGPSHFLCRLFCIPLNFKTRAFCLGQCDCVIQTHTPEKLTEKYPFSTIYKLIEYT